MPSVTGSQPAATDDNDGIDAGADVVEHAGTTVVAIAATIT
jgi:hypothetical protein